MATLALCFFFAKVSADSEDPPELRRLRGAGWLSVLGTESWSCDVAGEFRKHMWLWINTYKHHF